MTENLQKTFDDLLGRTTVSKVYDEEYQKRVGKYFLRRLSNDTTLRTKLEFLDYNVGKYIDFVALGKCFKSLDQSYPDLLWSIDCDLESEDCDVGHEAYFRIGYDDMPYDIEMEDFCKPEMLGKEILNDERIKKIFDEGGVAFEIAD